MDEPKKQEPEISTDAALTADSIEKTEKTEKTSNVENVAAKDKIEVSDEIKEIGALIRDKMPNVSTHVLRANEDKVLELAESNITDETGAIFDPSIHMQLLGEPVYRKGTKTFRLKPGAKPKNAQRETPVNNNTHSQEKQAVKSNPLKTNPKGSARMCTSVYFTSGYRLIGNSFLPDDKAETATIETLFEDFFRSSDGVEMSPFTALCIGLGFHSLTKVFAPKADKDRKNIWSRIKSFFGPKKAKADTTPSDNETEPPSRRVVINDSPHPIPGNAVVNTAPANSAESVVPRFFDGVAS